MRVLVISHTYISPINRDKWHTFAMLHKDVSLMVVFPSYWPACLFNHQAHINHQEQLDNCTFLALPAFKTGNELLYYYQPYKFYQTISSFRPNLIHVEQGQGAMSYFQSLVYNSLLFLGAKTVFFTWINWQPHHSLKHRFFLSPIEKLNLARAHGAIAGNKDAETILRTKGFKKPIIVLPQLGVNLHKFKQGHFPSAQKYIGFIGRLAKEKGIFNLLNVFFRLADMFKDWHLVFIGQGPESNALKNIIAGHKTRHRIHVGNPVEHEKVASLLNKINILVLPSYDTPTWREQFGHILIEAMACKVPIIGSDAGEIPHVINTAGLIFRQQDEDSLLAQLQKLIQDENLRKQIGEHGYQRVVTHYSHEAIAKKTYAFWQKIMS